MYFERAERARYRSATRVRVCASVSNRQLGSGLEVPFKTSFAQLAELHTVSHSAATPARGNMPAATRVKFNELFVGAWYPTDPPVYPRCDMVKLEKLQSSRLPCPMVQQHSWSAASTLVTWNSQRGSSGAGNLGNSQWEFNLQMSPIPGIPGIRNIVHA